MPAAARIRGRSEFIKAKPRNDVYTILLTISLFSLLIGCLLLYWDYTTYGSKKAVEVQKATYAGAAAPAPTTPAPAATPPATAPGAEKGK